MISRIGACIAISALLAIFVACDYGYKRSDYQGGFYTASGTCPVKGEVTISLLESNDIANQPTRLEIVFYCFLKICGQGESLTVQGGYFHIKQDQGHYIEGRITQDEAKGTWFLPMKNGSCSGQWVTLRNN